MTKTDRLNLFVALYKNNNLYMSYEKHSSGH